MGKVIKVIRLLGIKEEWAGKGCVITDFEHFLGFRVGGCCAKARRGGKARVL
jgi:hypothetical protein